MDPKPKVKWESQERGAKQILWKLANLKTHATQTFTQTENTGRQLMVSPPRRLATSWAGGTEPSHSASQLTDCSQLRENFTGAPNSSWWPVTKILGKSLFTKGPWGENLWLTNSALVSTLSVSGTSTPLGDTASFACVRELCSSCRTCCVVCLCDDLFCC